MDFIFIEDLGSTPASASTIVRRRPATSRIESTFGGADSAAQHDDIADTINYATVIERIRERAGAAAFQSHRITRRIRGEAVVR